MTLPWITVELFEDLLAEWLHRHNAICQYGNEYVYCARVSSHLPCLHPPPNSLVNYVKLHGDPESAARLNIELESRCTDPPTSSA
jgi:hypothetical protein